MYEHYKDFMNHIQKLIEYLAGLSRSHRHERKTIGERKYWETIGEMDNFRIFV